jgi:hypothetical protein
MNESGRLAAILPIPAGQAVFILMNSHRGHREHREFITPLCLLCALWLTIFIHVKTGIN